MYVNFLLLSSASLPGTLLSKGSQTSFLPSLCFLSFITAIKSVSMAAKSNEKAKRPRIVSTLEIKLKIIADFEAGKKFRMWT